LRMNDNTPTARGSEQGKRSAVLVANGTVIARLEMSAVLVAHGTVIARLKRSAVLVANGTVCARLACTTGWRHTLSHTCSQLLCTHLHHRKSSTHTKVAALVVLEGTDAEGSAHPPCTPPPPLTLLPAQLAPAPES